MTTTLKILAIPTLVLLGSAFGDTLDVSIKDRAFVPPTLAVKEGDVVRWTNNDRMDHTTNSKGNWDSGRISASKAFAYAFNAAGTFDYTCTLHKNMKGSVEVKSTSATPTDKAKASGRAAKPPTPAPKPPVTAPPVTPPTPEPSGGSY